MPLRRCCQILTLMLISFTRIHIFLLCTIKPPYRLAGWRVLAATINVLTNACSAIAIRWFATLCAQMSTWLVNLCAGTYRQESLLNDSLAKSQNRAPAETKPSLTEMFITFARRFPLGHQNFRNVAFVPKYRHFMPEDLPAHKIAPLYQS